MAGVFHTADVDQAAYLRCKNVRYLRIERCPSNPNLADFVFDETPELYAALREWGDDAATVNAREFAKRRRKLFTLARVAVAGGR